MWSEGKRVARQTALNLQKFKPKQTLCALSVEGTIIKHKTYTTRAAIFTKHIVSPPEPNCSSDHSRNNTQG